MEEVTGPVYGYRVYGSEVIQDGPWGTRRALTPVHIKWMINGEPSSGMEDMYGEKRRDLITIDLFDWHTSPYPPELESKSHIWVHGGSEYAIGDVEMWWPQSEAPGRYGSDSDVEARQRMYARLKGGIHSFKELGNAVEYARYFRGPLMSHMGIAILAKIELGGVVVEHEDGWRSEKSRIVDLMAFAGVEVRENIARQIGWPFEIGVPGE